MAIPNPTAPCWCGSHISYRDCHADFDRRIADFARQGHKVPPHKIIKTPDQIAGIRESAKINIAVLDTVAQSIAEGMSTAEIDRIVHQKTSELGGIPAPLGYRGFPKSVCTSVNSQVCHGIPDDDVILRDGDIVNVDVSTIYNGYYSDSSRMFYIGTVSNSRRKLVETAKKCVELGLHEVKPWTFLGNVGAAVQAHAHKHGYSVVREVGGHGVGLEFHEEPFVSYVSRRGTEMLLVPGMIFTIEPMINMGTDKIFIDRKNGWTIYTADGKPSAQWEIMVLVTEDGHEVLAY